MKAIIVGAGEFGRLLAATLCAENHDVVIVDTDLTGLERLTDKLDVMTVEGSCASIATLKQAGAQDADALLAVSGDEAANIISCQLGAKLGIKRTICRLYSADCFSERDGITPDQLGIWRTVSPPEECVRKIKDVLENEVLLEKIRFSNPNAMMDVFEVTPSSLLAGLRIKDIPAGSQIVDSIRFAAIVRGCQFLIPHGDTLFVPGDKVYVAGHKDHVNHFFELVATDSKPVERVIISGASDTGKMLAKEVWSMGIDVRLIEKERKKGEKLLDELPPGIMLIHGDTTDEEVLEEAGISACDVFVSTAPDDEDNILSCIIAKRSGAKKVIAMTHKPEYIRIVPTMETIDCGFSATLVSVNTVLRLLETGMLRVDAILQRFNAHLTEFRVTRNSPLCGRLLVESKLPSSIVLALIFRKGEVITPSGSTCFEEGDIAVAIVTAESEKELQPFFPDH